MREPARRHQIVGAAIWVLLGSALAIPSLGWLVRASQRWGASEGEAAGKLPGDELVPDGWQTTYAITIDAPPGNVWAWLVQIAVAEAGFTPTPGSSGSLARTSTILTTWTRGFDHSTSGTASG